jgi:hypothetical protein
MTPSGTQNVSDIVISSSRDQSLQLPSHSPHPVETNISKKDIIQTNSKPFRLNEKNSNKVITIYNTPPFPGRRNFADTNPSTANSKHYSTPQQTRKKPTHRSHIEPATSLPKPIPSSSSKRRFQRHEYSPIPSSVPSPSPLISPAVKVGPNINKIIKSIYSNHNPPSQSTSSLSPKSKLQRARIMKMKNETVNDEPNTNNCINNTKASTPKIHDISSLFEQEDNITNEVLSPKGNITPSSSPLSSSPYTNVNFLEYRITSPSRPMRLYV